jgi:hypothetical protein
MQTLKIILTLCIGCLVTSITAQAQLVHLSYSGTVRVASPGDNWFAPGELVIGQTPVWIDISYHPELSGSTNGVDPIKFYHPEDDPLGRASDYTFRVRFGTVDLTKELSFLAVSDDGTGAKLSGESFGLGHELDFVSRIDPPGPTYPLPTTLPADVDEFDRIGTAGIVLFSNLPEFPQIDAGLLLVDLRKVTLTREFTPVPEPSMYGLFGVALLGGVLVMRRQQSRRSTEYCRAGGLRG